MAVQKLNLLPVMQDGGPKVISVSHDSRWGSKSYICCLCCKMVVQKLYLLSVLPDGGLKFISVARDSRWGSKSYICCLWCKMVVQKLNLLSVLQDGGRKFISVARDSIWGSKIYIWFPWFKMGVKSHICCLWCKIVVQKLYLLPVIQDGGQKVIMLPAQQGHGTKRHKVAL